jgi:hypothetical protein
MGKLMKKTKAELVDIIQRKDGVEVNLREELKCCKEELEQLNIIKKGSDYDIDKLNKTIELAEISNLELKKDNEELTKILAEKEYNINSFEDIIDEYQINIMTLTKRSSFYRDLSIFLILIIISELLIILEFIF